MPQRPKFKVPNYGMGRKSSKDDESAVNDEKQSTSTKAMATGTQKVNSKNVMICKATVPKSIWQGRVKRGGQQRLPTIPEVKEVPKEYIDRCNQTDKRKLTLTDEDLKLLLPINRYIDYKLHQYNFPELLSELANNILSIEHINLQPQFAITLPEPRFAWRIEVNLSSNPSAIYLILSGFLWKTPLDDKLSTPLMLNAYDQSNRTMAENFYARLRQPTRKEPVQRSTCFLSKIPTFCKSTPNRLMKIVLTYFVVFCVIGFLFTLFL
ncbi:uncharacterized protein LOC111604744 [Drosophila hydei]|uniref:Uncharacterized protein LOC111604744 n=1 Tax=Drosophila hydei TaxID=7224 RepID=A0A6J1MBK4_DROHY|nr:uncharacterized protein LOC111604744 [Drosophila hydei]